MGERGVAGVTPHDYEESECTSAYHGKVGTLVITQHFLDWIDIRSGNRAPCHRQLVSTDVKFSDEVPPQLCEAIVEALAAKQYQRVVELLNGGAPTPETPDIPRLTKDFIHDQSKP